MKADYSSHNQDSLSFSLEDAARSQVHGPSRFARALKQARFARGWTQADLAARLPIPKRAIVSWETAERVPSIGMVMLLVDTLRPEEEVSLRHDLITAYIADDLERLKNRSDHKTKQVVPFFQRIQRILESVLQLSSKNVVRPSSQEHRTDTRQSSDQRNVPAPPQQMGEQQTLEPLLALMARFQQHPELIAVVSDFIQELVPQE